MVATQPISATTNNHGLIFLIGFMGCGKTTLGKKLASKLKYPFIDLDEVFEQQAGMTIVEYFKIHGEDQFREVEAAVLKGLDYPAHAVVSTGGGLPCFFDNMAWMNAHGKTVYIKLAPNALAERLENGKADRPLLREKHGDELVAFIAEKLQYREQFYGQATFIAGGINITPARVIDLLAQRTL